MMAVGTMIFNMATALSSGRMAVATRVNSLSERRVGSVARYGPTARSSSANGRGIPSMASESSNGLISAATKESS